MFPTSESHIACVTTRFGSGCQHNNPKENQRESGDYGVLEDGKFCASWKEKRGKGTDDKPSFEIKIR